MLEECTFYVALRDEVLFHHLTPNEVITKMASKGKSNTLLIRFEM